MRSSQSLRDLDLSTGGVTEEGAARCRAPGLRGLHFADPALGQLGPKGEVGSLGSLGSIPEAEIKGAPAPILRHAHRDRNWRCVLGAGVLGAFSMGLIKHMACSFWDPSLSSPFTGSFQGEPSC